ncbi:DegV family protein [Paraliobacillus sp. JSM ZJ581]|uniref:DegV family protein n=1 Tax=Paraliobacillus sp. JSM ZJ581 TaxID=3342118 RepID=UPI0035A96E73
MSVVVMTDSTAYIPADVRDELNIEMLPLNVLIDDVSYEEEIDLTADDFYPLVRKAKELPKTSQPSIGYIKAQLEKLAANYDAIVSIHLSSGISGTYQALVAASDMVDNVTVYPFDSEISCMAQGFYVLEAAEMAKSGADAPTIMNRLNEIKQTMRGYFVVDDLTHLHRGGRLNGAQALVGSMLQVKPVLHFVDKKIVPFEKIRTQKKAIKRIITLFDEDASTGKSMRAAVVHANRPQEAEALKQELACEYNNVEITISYFGAVIGTHLGEGALGLVWYMK